MAFRKGEKHEPTHQNNSGHFYHQNHQHTKSFEYKDVFLYPCGRKMNGDKIEGLYYYNRPHIKKKLLKLGLKIEIRDIVSDHIMNEDIKKYSMIAHNNIKREHKRNNLIGLPLVKWKEKT